MENIFKTGKTCGHIEALQPFKTFQGNISLRYKITYKSATGEN